MLFTVNTSCLFCSELLEDENRDKSRKIEEHEMAQEGLRKKVQRTEERLAKVRPSSIVDRCFLIDVGDPCGKIILLCTVTSILLSFSSDNSNRFMSILFVYI